MDEFKKHIQNHAEELNLDEPSPQVWENIRRESRAVKRTPVIMMVTRWAVAACVLVLAGIGIWSVLSNKKTTYTEVAAVTTVKKADTPAQIIPVQPQPVPETKEPGLTAAVKTVRKTQPNHKVAKPAMPADHAEMTRNLLHNIETSFTQVINLQRDKVSSIPMYAESPEYFNDFKIQIRQMEKDEKVIKSDIAKRGMTDVLLDQLITLYQQKLNTLKQLQTEMNKTNNRYKQNRSPVDSSRTYFLTL